MTRTSILSGTRHAGRDTAHGAARRGHAVASYSRQLPDDRIAGIAS
jgi:hypothetical protein